MVFCMFLAGCSQQEEELRTERTDDSKRVAVTLQLDLSPLDGDTRSESSLTSNVENLIHEIRVCQYDEMGVRIVNELCYEYDAGQTQVYSVTTHLVEASNSTVVVLVNMEDYVSEYTVPPLYNTLLQTKYPFSITSGMEMVPMSGYITGSIEEGQVLRVSLARLVSRINLTVNNNTGANLSDVTVQLLHRPIQTYICQDSNGRADLNDDDYTDDVDGMYEDEATSLLAGNGVTFYYYVLPNYCSSNETNATRVRITTGDGRTYEKALGGKAFGQESGTYSLSANAVYSVTLNLGNK